MFIKISKGFRAVIQNIDPTTINFEGAPPEIFEVDGDTFKIKFRTRDMVDAPVGNGVTLKITGKLFDGTKFEGGGVVNVKP